MRSRTNAVPNPGIWALSGAAIALLVSVAFASDHFSWDDLASLNESYKFTVDQWDESDGLHTLVVAERGPLVAGTFEVKVTVKTESTDATNGTLLRFRFLIGDDTDGNGTVDANEWTLVDSATASQQGQWTTAEGTAVIVVAFKDRYSVEFDWRNPDDTEWTGGNDIGDSEVEAGESTWSLGEAP